jgi:hypothetical protein
VTSSLDSGFQKKKKKNYPAIPTADPQLTPIELAIHAENLPDPSRRAPMPLFQLDAVLWIKSCDDGRIALFCLPGILAPFFFFHYRRILL